MSKLTEARIYWDFQDPRNEGWAWRTWQGEREESGPWDWPLPRDADATQLAEAVVDLCWIYDTEIGAGAVAVERHDGGCATWTR